MKEIDFLTPATQQLLNAWYFLTVALSKWDGDIHRLS